MTSVREQGIFVELEASPGTPETLVGADALLVSNISANPVSDLRMIDRNVIVSSLNPKKSIYGGSLFELSFDVELAGSGSAGTAPQALGDLLQACGMDETVVASTSVTYTPSSDLSSHATVTVGYREGANYRILKGARGTVSLNATTGEYARLSFTLKGRIDSESETAAPTPSFTAVDPEPFLDATFSVGGYAGVINALTFDVANTLAVAPNPNNPDGFGDIRITARGPNGTFDPEATAIGTKDWVGILRAGTSQAIQTGVIGDTAGNRWALSVPLAYFKNISYGDREELLTHSIEFACEDTDGADDFSLQLT